MVLVVSGTAGLQDANANGDTRTLQLYHEHTKESASITYRHNGRYVSDGLRQLNWLLRDWRIDEQISMDPKLFDIVWQVYREAGARGPIHVNSAYRSPQTNAALRRRSRGVAQFSQHMRGKALDFFLEGVSMARVREIGLKLQYGGVGFYPHSRHQFVHLDAGGVRSWPRLPDAHLARLFPDGRTVHIPASGQPLARYEEAKAAILARGGTVAGYTAYAEEGGGRRKSFWARLFGGGEDEDEDLAAPGMSGRQQTASAGMNDSDGGSRNFFSFFQSSPPAPEPAPVPLPEPITTTASLPAPSLPPPGQVRAAAAVVPATPVSAVSAPIAVPLPPRRPAAVAAIVKPTPSKPVVAKAPPPKGPAPKTPAVKVAAAAPPTPPGRRGETPSSARKSAATTGAKDKSATQSRSGAATPAAASAKAKEAKTRTAFSSKVETPRESASSRPTGSRRPSGR